MAQEMLTLPGFARPRRATIAFWTVSRQEFGRRRVSITALLRVLTATAPLSGSFAARAEDDGVAGPFCEGSGGSRSATNPRLFVRASRPHHRSEERIRDGLYRQARIDAYGLWT